MLCLIIESYLPPDFYIDMYGAKTYATILVKILEQYNLVPNVLQKFNEMNYPIVNIGSQLFLSLFTMCLPERESLKVLDLIFMEGMMNTKLIFDITLAYFRIMEPQILKSDNF